MRGASTTAPRHRGGGRARSAREPRAGEARAGACEERRSNGARGKSAGRRAVAAVPGSARFCHRRPPAGIQSAAPECARWVTAASRDAGGCANATCVPPISLLSFEREIRAWFRALAELARRDPSAGNATDGNTSEDLIYARLRGDVIVRLAARLACWW